MSTVLKVLAFAALLSTQAFCQGIVSVDPDSAHRGESLPVSITGAGTYFEQGSFTITSVWFEQGTATIYANNVNVYSWESLEAYFIIPASAPLGLWDVMVNTTGYPTWSLPDGFRIYPEPVPQIVAVDPDSARLGEDLWVSITGQHTSFEQGSDVTTGVFLEFSQISSTIHAGNVSVFSPTYLEAYFSIPEDALLGLYHVHTDVTGQQWVSLDYGFRVYLHCGDVDHSGTVNVADAVYLLGYIFGGQPAPYPQSSGDVDCSGGLNIGDVVYMIGYILGGGADPCDPDGDQVLDCGP
jgi:hypothetical protein